MMMAGEMVGSLVFMKLVSMDFARKAFGRNEPLMTVPVFFLTLGVTTSIMAVVVHFF
jgi:hypothetical protein